MLIITYHIVFFYFFLNFLYTHVVHGVREYDDDNNNPSIHHLFKQSEQTYKKSKSIKNMKCRARCHGTRKAVISLTRGP